MEEQGYIVHLKNGDATFTAYSFTENFTENDTVFFSGPAFEGTILGEHLGECETVTFALEALSAAIEKNLDLSSVGAGGILVQKTPHAADGNRANVLFLPGNLFERSAVNLDEADFCENQGFYFYKGLSSRDALIFLRAAIAYRSLTGSFPFPKTDLLDRQVDIFDHCFLPLELCIQGVDKNLAQSIDAGLMIFGEDDCFEGNTRFVDEKKKAEREGIISRVQSFRPQSFAAEKSKIDSVNNMEESDDFKKARADFIKKRNRKIFFSRIYRRNKNFIRLSLVAAVVIVYGMYNFHKTNQNLATSIGLTSTETARALYTFISNADVPDLQEIVAGKKTKDLIVQVASFHVRSKERVGFNENGKIVPVAERLFYKPDSQYWMFGITNLKIDGSGASVLGEFKKRRDKPMPISEEDSVALSKNDEKTHRAEYFLVVNDESFINVQRISEDVTLSWNGKKWLVTSIEGNSVPSRVKMKDFWNDFRDALQKTEGNVPLAAENIRPQYEWLPSAQDLQFYFDKF